MNRLEEVLAEAVGDADLPFVVAAVADRSQVLWEGSVGQARPARPAGPDTVFRLYSATKAIGAVGAMILIDRGLLEPDTVVTSVLPEFDDIRVLESIGEGGPVLRRPKRALTLRDLLTHTSGFAYDTWNAQQLEYQQVTGMPHIIVGTLASMYYPLQFDPGEGFAYGIGFDWVGRMIERLDGRRIDVFLREEVFEPLEMHDTAFVLDGMESRLADLSARAPDGAFETIGHASIEDPERTEPEFFGLGGGLFGTAPDYLRFLQMLLNGGEWNGRRIISEGSLALLFENQIGSMSVPRLTCFDPTISCDVEFFPGTRKTHTLGFFRVEEDIPDGRHAGSVFWAGGANSHYWLDPSTGLAAVFMSQCFPFCEPRVMARFATFESAVYEQFGGRARASIPARTSDWMRGAQR
jgi:methyl acetate hydrolase